MTQQEYSEMLLQKEEYMDEIRTWVPDLLRGNSSVYDLGLVSAIENKYREKLVKTTDEAELNRLRITMTTFIGESVIFHGGGNWFYCLQKRAYNFHQAGITGWGTGETYDISAEGILTEIEAGEETDLLKTQLEYIRNRDELKAKSDQLFNDLMKKKEP